MFYQHVGFQVLAAVPMNNSVFWHTTPYRSLKVDRRFGVTYCLKIKGRSKSEAKFRRKQMNLKMEATCRSETSVDFQPNTQKTELVISACFTGRHLRIAAVGAGGSSLSSQDTLPAGTCRDQPGAHPDSSGGLYLCKTNDRRRPLFKLGRNLRGTL
jgi:hypothetical protein